MSNSQIILVEDDAVIAELLEFNLVNNGYAVHAFGEGRSLFQSLPRLPAPDLFILDLMLPGMDGYEICARLRQEAAYELVPILMLTARSAESDKVRGLETGADDYLTKPFGMRELLARVAALIRRYQKTGLAMAAAVGGESAATTGTTSPAESPAPGAAEGSGSTLRDGQIACRNILVDDIRHRVYRDSREIDMTNREYELLKYLMIHKGVAFSRDELLDRVWGYEYGGETRTVDVHIRQLRRKLEDDDANPVLIETVRGRGYRWTDLF